MNLDLNLLAARLIEEKEGSVLPQSSCNKYLMDHVLLPLLRGETVFFGSIDYNAFDDEDIGSLAAYNDLVYYWTRTLEQAAEKIADIKPVARPVRQFC